MNKLRFFFPSRWTVIALLAVFILQLGPMLCVEPVKAEGVQPTITVTPQPMVNRVIPVKVDISNFTSEQELSGFNLKVNYDPAVVQYDSYTKGEFLSDWTWMKPNVETSQGSSTLDFSTAKLSGTNPSLSQGNILTIYFKLICAIGEGQPQFSVPDIHLRDSNNQEIPVTLNVFEIPQDRVIIDNTIGGTVDTSSLTVTGTYDARIVTSVHVFVNPSQDPNWSPSTQELVQAAATLNNSRFSKNVSLVPGLNRILAIAVCPAGALGSAVTTVTCGVGAPIITVAPQPMVNRIIPVKIDISNFTPTQQLLGFNLKVAYDPAVVQYDSYTKGEFLPDWDWMKPSVETGQSSSTLDFSTAKLSGTNPSLSQGNILTINFKLVCAAGEGHPQFSIPEIHLRDGNNQDMPVTLNLFEIPQNRVIIDTAIGGTVNISSLNVTGSYETGIVTGVYVFINPPLDPNWSPSAGELGQAAATLNNGRFSKNVTLVPGPNRILALAVCPAGALGSAVAAVTYDENVVIPVSIMTTGLPSATQGVYYSQTLQATGGSGSYTWSVESGRLPVGISLSAVGVISGTPTENGTFNFSVKVTDSVNTANSMTQILSLLVNPGSNLPNVIAGTVYGYPGKTIVVPISIKGSPGLSGAQFKLKYDPSIVVASEVFTGKLTQSFNVLGNFSRASQGEALIALIDTSPSGSITGDGTICMVKFNVVGSVGNSTFIEISEPVLNMNGEEYLVATKSGWANCGYRYGDLNHSHTVNVTDAVMTMRASIDLLTLDDELKRIADVNGSGGVNVTDAVIIMRYSIGLLDAFPVELNSR